MQRIRFMFKQFLKEPLWFKILIPTTLLISIIFSSSYFSDNGYYESSAKLAAAVFLGAYGIKMRRNRQISALFFVLVVICIYLSWDSFQLARL
jgi:hypothetical protein